MMKKQSGGSRSFSTSARRLQDVQASKGDLPSEEASAALVANMISQVDHGAAEMHTGLKFQAPEALPKTENFRTRYEPLLDQFTKLLMHDGKLALAQKVCLLSNFFWGHAMEYGLIESEHVPHFGPTPNHCPPSTKLKTSPPPGSPGPPTPAQPSPLPYPDRGLRGSPAQDP